MFRGTRQRLIAWLGFDRSHLTTEWKAAVDRYSENGAKKKVGEIAEIEILHRNDGSSPVHQSSYNPNDKNFIISARITPADGGIKRTHHIYMDGTGTFKKGDKREYSTSSRG